MNVGSVVFGPMGDVTTDASYRRMLSGQGVLGVKAASDAQACHCVGPQPGQKKCPCALRAESEQGRRMISEGVTIDGVRYNLVRAE